jgi:hypothetical protein
MLFLYQYILPTHNASMTKINNITHYNNNITHYNNNILHYDNNNNNKKCVQQSSVLQVFNLIDLYMMIALYL